MRSSTLIAAAVAAISATVSAQRALKVVKDDLTETSTQYHYLGWCDPQYESANGTIQYHRKYTCSAANLLEVKYYPATDATCTGQAYTLKDTVTTHGGNFIDARPVSLALPATGRSLYILAALSSPSMAGPVSATGIEDSLYVTYSCVDADSDDLDLRTETETTYREEGCPEDGKICNFERLTTNYCYNVIDKTRANWAVSYKVEDEYRYTWDGIANCDGDWTEKIKRTETYLEKCTTRFVGNGYDTFPSGWGFSSHKCADAGGTDIDDGKSSYTKYETGLYLDEDGEQQQSGASATFGALPLAVVVGAQLFGTDMPILRVLSVTLAVVAFANPTMAERVWQYKEDSTTFGRSDSGPSRVCAPTFRQPSQTELRNEFKYGIHDGYTWSYCDGADKIKTDYFAKDDSECEDPVITEEHRLNTDDTLVAKKTGYVTLQYCYKSSSTCLAVNDAAKTQCAAKKATLSFLKVSVVDNCATTGCISWTDTARTDCTGVTNGCDASTSVSKTCTINTPIDAVTSCPDAPEGMGFLKVTAYADAACTTACNFETVVTGVCKQQWWFSEKYTVTGNTVTKDHYDASTTCTGNVLPALTNRAAMWATPIGSCLAASTYNDTTTSVSQSCVVGYGAGGSGSTDFGAMSYKIEYVAESYGESAAAGLGLHSISAVVIAAAVATKLF
jgi:hypothetical protein